jgi:hypothetical protein
MSTPLERFATYRAECQAKLDEGRRLGTIAASSFVELYDWAQELYSQIGEPEPAWYYRGPGLVVAGGGGKILLVLWGDCPCGRPQDGDYVIRFELSPLPQEPTP